LTDTGEEFREPETNQVIGSWIFIQQLERVSVSGGGRWHEEGMGRAREVVAGLVAAALLGGLNGQVPDPAALGLRPATLRQLVRALEGERLLAPRLAAQRSWSRCGAFPSQAEAAGEGTCGSGFSPSREIREIGRQIETEASERPDGETLHALGLWRLLSASRVEDADLAVSILRQAAGYLPAGGEVWNDLAAAYFVRGRRWARPEDLVRSLAACDRALEVAPGLRAALFNRALALAALHLRGEAARAFERFLAAGDSRQWNTEARARLEALVLPERPRALSLSQRLAEAVPSASTASVLSKAEIEEAVAVDPVDAFRFVELNLLGDGGSARSGEARSGEALSGEENLRLARLASAALRERFADRLLADEVTAWEQVMRGAPGDPRRRSLAAGYADFRLGASLYETLDTARARERFSAAARELGRGGSPLRLWAVYWRAVCDYWNGDAAGAETKLGALQASAARESLILDGYSALMLGLIAADRSDFDRALEQYRRAVASFERAGAGEAADFSRTLLAEVFARVNDPQAGWQQLYKALASAPAWRNQRWRHALFDQAADSVRALGEPEAALYFQAASLRAALLSGQAAPISEEYAFRSVALARLGRPARAAADAAAARRWLGKITDVSVRQRGEDSVLVAEAHVAGRERPAAAVDALGKAIEDRRGQGTTALLAELELAGLKRMQEAEGALLGAVEAIEAGSLGLGAEQRRSAYFAIVREVFDEMIRFELDVRHDERAALVFADRARVHEFLTARVNRGRHPTPAGLDALQARLGPDEGVLVYRVLDDRLLVWLVQREAVVFRPQELPARRLATLVDNLDRSLHDPHGKQVPFGLEAVGRWRDALSSWLIAPVADRLAGVGRLWIVPDGPLFQVPFAVLADPSSGRFLGEGRRLAKSLTAGLAEEPFPAGPSREAGPARLLAVGDPDLSTSHVLTLPRLPHAREEASAAAAEYPRSALLVGAAATRAGFLAALDRWEVVHFAGHALLNPEAPDLSMLVLAPGADGKDSGSLYASEIERLALQHTRLVVLSACGGAGGPRAAGFYGLARPFLAAGVPVVVGSLWQVDDAATAQFFSSFHHSLRAGKGDPLDALQRSQTADLNHGKPTARAVYRWAAFEAYVARPQTP
jgi:CHAT domain-containing protein